MNELRCLLSEAKNLKVRAKIAVDGQCRLDKAFGDGRVAGLINPNVYSISHAIPWPHDRPTDRPVSGITDLPAIVLGRVHSGAGRRMLATTRPRRRRAEAGTQLSMPYARETECQLNFGIDARRHHSDFVS